MAVRTRNSERVRPGQVWESNGRVWKVLSDFYAKTMYGLPPDDPEATENTHPFDIEVCDVEYMPTPSDVPCTMSRLCFDYGSRLMIDAPPAAEAGEAA